MTDSQVEKYFADENFLAPIKHFILAQYSINKGLKMFGHQGEEAITKEQLHDLDTFIPMKADELTEGQKNLTDVPD